MLLIAHPVRLFKQSLRKELKAMSFGLGATVWIVEVIVQDMNKEVNSESQSNYRMAS